ncbi:LamG-like jellyroll fold domain-containing protein [Sedimentisphaera salicampi]|uniref:Immunoglobulin I-set domain protein n=1 Tax=Sedimentisphaera salicampi TaxID=1941349 RepID=A0A1W6LKF6_9BACT|nr:LamG-like jellyroll fold domain-containing protein [Sedimentisphaera salicampi]ARN56236.1 Immunoglobulin I-set domain protein [Sedimentisphaera salicampi]
MKSIFSVVMAMIFAHCAAFSAEGTELISNGGFQDPNLPGANNYVTTVTDWVSGHDDNLVRLETKEVDNRTAVPGPEGNQVLRMTGGWSTGVIQQSTYHPWSHAEVYRLSFNACSVRWEAPATDGVMGARLLQDDAEMTELWSAEVDMTGTHTGANEVGDWEPYQAFEFEIDPALFSGEGVSEGSDLILEVSSVNRNHWVDNVSLQAEPAAGAHNPVPAYGADNVGTPAGNQVDVNLQWNTGLDPSNPSQINPDITEHHLFMSEDQNVSEDPNLYYVDTIALGTESPEIASVTVTGLNFDGLYYWSVDEGLGYPVGSQDNIAGADWMFETLQSVPIITQQPESQVVSTGDTAAFTLTADSISQETYQWYLSADGVIDPAEDQAIGSTDTDPTLTIDNVQLSDEGYYYCEVTNDGGTVYSDTAGLAVKRIVAHWTLDTADFVNDTYLDSSGEGRDAVPYAVPAVDAFVPGADPAKTNEGLDLDENPDAAALGGTDSPAEFSDEITVSLWVKSEGVPGSWTGIVSKRQDPDWQSGSDWFWTIPPSGDYMSISSAGVGTENLSYDPPAEGEWTHLAFTANADGGKLYYNGVNVDTEPDFKINKTDAQLVIGGSILREDGTIGGAFNGVMDDLRIYNYAKDEAEIADIYYDISETPVCSNMLDLDLQFDVAGGGPEGDQPDCKIGLPDFLEFASTWLNCGLYPEDYCY